MWFDPSLFFWVHFQQITADLTLLIPLSDFTDFFDFTYQKKLCFFIYFDLVLGQLLT